MSALSNVVRALAGLFVDDGRLALAILGMVGLAAIISMLVSEPLAAGMVLLGGCLGVLVANVASAARR
jgi:hypothetical protein